MKTLDEVIKACEETVSDVDRGVDIEGCYLGATETKDALHYLNAYRQLSQGLVGENTEIRPEGIYCKVCGTRLDKDWDDEDAQ